MLSVDDVLAARSGKAYDSDGDKVGSVGEVYLDDQTGQPAWVTVNTGLFGTSESFVPLEGARVEGDDLHLPYSKAKIKDAPRQDADKHLDVEQEEALYHYYGLGNGAGDRRDFEGDRDRRDFDGDRDRDTAVGGAAGTTGAAGVAGAAGRDRDFDGDRRDVTADRDRDGHTVDDKARDIADNGDGEGVVRHEERVNVGTERRESGKARLRKYVVTDQQQVDVPVSREEVNVTREPMNERASNVTLGEQTETVTLHEERPVVDKETVAVERVGLDVDEVRDTERVQTEVAHEEVEVDTDGTRGRTGDRDVDAARGRTADRDGDGHTIDDKARDFKNKH
ncbi:DUF2382 domain-containing protein [Dermacoccus sp. Tok2021]|uniref:DUF2382 domain-containing protein n=1 Tax=Dermacoccus sp. Tok2021 TaxID=2826873 RepID=UPI001CA7355F|nr:PRC and DUF2382 domain-containing protein [Dermacoccus sp. Tok2021]MBZ4498921.1 PRC and DUF2382 domain-containing protein [Dermacoccus sp. Tok2021]